MRLRRSKKRADQRGLSPFMAGLISVALVAIAVFFAFTKANPFANPYELKGAFQNANSLKANSPVRIAGVEVGKVKTIEAIPGGKKEGAAIVTMELKKSALPIHEDAQLKVRPRVFLEGNFFVDIKPGSPSAKTLKSGQTIPTNQTASPVQLGEVLAALQSDTRSDLQVFLKEYSKGLEGKGARGFNEALRTGPRAFRSTAIASDALLGIEPTKDLQRVFRGQARTFAALNEDENALKGLVTNFNTVAGAFASQDAALERTIPALDRTLRVGSPALASLNSALPTLRVFSREALPGVRSSGPTLEASLPFIKQARLLVRPTELRGTARQLRLQIPNFVTLSRRSVPLLGQARSLSSCTNTVLVPFANTPVPNPDEPKDTNQKPLRQANRGFVGLSGESRVNDGNLSYFRTSAIGPPDTVRPAAPSDGGFQPPPRRPDVACETQEKPNLNAPGGSVLQFPTGGSGATAAALRKTPSKIDGKKLLEARSLFRKWQKTEGAKAQKKFDKGFKKLAEEAKP